MALQVRRTSARAGRTRPPGSPGPTPSAARRRRRIRTRPMPTTAQTSGASALRSPACSASSITRPVRYGKVMEHAIRPAALSGGDRDLAGCGRRKRSRRRRTSQGDSPVNDREAPRGPQGRGALLDERPAARPPLPPDRVRRAQRQRGARPRRRSAALVDACRVPRVRVLERSLGRRSQPQRHHPRRASRSRCRTPSSRWRGSAIDRIDLRRHRGAHPRIGALDVVPIVALDDDDIPVRLGGRARASRGASAGAQPAGVPLRRGRDRSRSHASARLPARRAGGARPRRSTRASWRPTPARTASTRPPGRCWWACAPPLIALNVWLPDGTLTEARAIAARVRESGGGMPGVRALGLYLPEAGHGPGVDEHRGPPRRAAGGGHRGRPRRGRAPRHRGRRHRAGRPDPGRGAARRPEPGRAGAHAASTRAASWSCCCRPRGETPDGQAQAPQERGAAAGRRAQARARARATTARPRRRSSASRASPSPRRSGACCCARGSSRRSSTPT